MTVREAWNSKANRDNTTKVKDANEALKEASSLPAVLYVDGGNFFPDWLSSVKFAISRLSEDQFRQQDFFALVRQIAIPRFFQMVDGILQRFSDAHRMVVFWDNSDVIPVAKMEVHQSRRADSDQLRKIIEQRIGNSAADIITKLSNTGSLLFGPIPLPSTTVNEADGVDILSGLIGSRLDVKCIDEADLSLCRAELLDSRAVIVTQDSDLLFITSCPIIRYMHGGKLEVTKGRRSAYEIVWGQLVGQDYVNQKGLTDCGPKTATRMLAAIPHSLDARNPFELFDQLTIAAGEERNRLRRAIEIWWNRSHGIDGVVPNNDAVFTARRLRKKAKVQEVSNARLIFQMPPVPSQLPAKNWIKTSRMWYYNYHKTEDGYDGDKEALKEAVKESMRQEKKQYKKGELKQKKKISKLRGHEVNRLPPKQLIPTRQEVPQRIITEVEVHPAQAEVPTIYEGEGEDGVIEDGAEVEEEEEDENNAAVIVGGPLPTATDRLPTKFGPREILDPVFPRKTHKGTLQMLVRRFNGQFAQKSHPFTNLMQARVLAFRSASSVLTKALRIYFREIFYQASNHHLVAERFA